jgi:hypothetical protein
MMEDPKELIKDFIRSVKMLHIDINGNHRYMFSHRSHQIITRMRVYLDEAEDNNRPCCLCQGSGRQPNILDFAEYYEDD